MQGPDGINSRTTVSSEAWAVENGLSEMPHFNRPQLQAIAVLLDEEIFSHCFVLCTDIVQKQ
jgi:hypothetical protein